MTHKVEALPLRVDAVVSVGAALAVLASAHPPRVDAVAGVGVAVPSTAVTVTRQRVDTAASMGAAALSGSVATAVTASRLDAVASVRLPTANRSGRLSPSRVAASFSVPAPVVRLSRTASPSRVSGSASVFRPRSLFAVQRVAATAAVAPPTVSLSRRPAPSRVTAAASVAAPVLLHDNTMTPDLVSVSAQVFGIRRFIEASSVAAVADIYGVSATATASVPAGRVGASAAIPSPTVGNTRTATPDLVLALPIIVEPRVHTSPTVAAALVSAVASVPVPTRKTATRLRPSRVAAVGSLAAPLPLSTATATPSPVVASAAVGAAHTQSTRTVVASPVTASVALPAPSPVASSRPSAGITVGRVQVFAPAVAYDGTFVPALVVALADLHDPLVVQQIIAAVRVNGAATFLAPSISPRYDRGAETYGVFSAAEVACMRSTVEDFMPDAVTILRRSDVSDGMGSVTRSWVEQATVSGRLSPAGGGSVGGEVVRAGTLLAVKGWTLALPHGTTITTADRVLVNGHVHEVTEVTEARSWELYLNVRLARIS